MPRLPQHTNKRGAGFTLLEVLLAIAITGFVLSAATSLVVSVSNIWSSRQNSHFFEDHVDGVSEFLRAAFAEAGLAVGRPEANEPGSEGGDDDPSDADGGERAGEPAQATPGVSIEVPGNPGRSSARSSGGESRSGGLLSSEEAPIGWEKPPGFAAYQDPLLSFSLSEAPPLLVDLEDAPVIGVTLFLHFERGEGLSLLWYSQLQEETEDERDLRRTRLSDLVESIAYIYWDERFERWEEEPEPREGEDDNLLLPRYLKLTFVHNEVRTERTIALPLPSQRALLF